MDAFPKGLHGDVNPNFVPVLEAVRDGLAGGGDANRKAFEPVSMHSLDQSGSGEPDDRKVHGPLFWFASFAVNRDPDRGRLLRPKLVESERGQQTDDAVRDGFCDLN